MSFHCSPSLTVQVNDDDQEGEEKLLGQYLNVYTPYTSIDTVWNELFNNLFIIPISSAGLH